MKQKNETYLGDGLYASYDGFALWLRAPREHDDHVCALEPQVMVALLRWAAEIPRYNRLLIAFARNDLTPTLPEGFEAIEIGDEAPPVLASNPDVE